MTTDQLKTIAQQLRKPEGLQGIEVGNKMNLGNALINLATIEALSLKNNDKLLEIGMGNGGFVKDIFAINDSIKYVGCDYSQTMVDEAEKINKMFIDKHQAQFHHTGAEQLPFQDDSFNTVFTINTIYFWENITKILSEIWRVLKPGGTLIIALRPKSSMQTYPFTKYGFRMYNKKELSVALEKNAFRMIQFIEKEEPPQKVNGTLMKVETLIVCAQKEIITSI
ncbi:class I SAM-dependent methyltransferase [Aquimarina sp. 2201CG5-10]|uniref:class I SAM-dependent methyltransferase n=1 Tax=Aquimarina callyspongiae TaxID=3098150 RepID=UPI002AB3893D|nr:class I SAM-dependent methyltransferase [Aquimarina sp. 2201CG5-10]MDY8137429.1 class I SAM-dependent methyltransferase [Aquimarina sp. 2201CG5-10]